MNILRKIKKHGLKKSIYTAFRSMDELLGYPFSYLNYQKCLIAGRIYFGQYLAAKQGLPERHFVMTRLVGHDCSVKEKDRFNILEIGSWAGGSAITWANAIKKYNSSKGIVICVDPWTPYIDVGLNKSAVYKSMKSGLKRDRIFKLFQHNIITSGNGDIVFSLRGPSDERLLMLKGNYFDLIFIDGDHSYNAVSKDIYNASFLVKDGGLLCGDDLELQYSQIDAENTKSNIKYDYIIDPVAKEYFHPGVTLAVYDFFKTEVSTWYGLWAMRKIGNKWEKVDLSLDINNIEIPEHLKRHI